MARLTPAYYRTNVRAHTVPELLRMHGWINTAWILFWKLTGVPLPDSPGHLVPCYWDDMCCRAEDLSDACHQAATPLKQALRKFGDDWEIHCSKRACQDPTIIDVGAVHFFLPASPFIAQANYALTSTSLSGTTIYATTFLRSGQAIVTSSNRTSVPARPGIQLHFHRGTPEELLDAHQRAIANRPDIQVFDTFAEWTAENDRQTEIQAQWELDRGLWVREGSG